MVDDLNYAEYERARTAATLAAGVEAANADRYLAKAQAKALVAEIERLRRALADGDGPDDGPYPGPLRITCNAAFLKVVDSRGVGADGEPPGALIECGLCGATTWRAFAPVA